MSFYNTIQAEGAMLNKHISKNKSLDEEILRIFKANPDKGFTASEIVDIMADAKRAETYKILNRASRYEAESILSSFGFFYAHRNTDVRRGLNTLENDGKIIVMLDDDGNRVRRKHEYGNTSNQVYSLRTLINSK